MKNNPRLNKYFDLVECGRVLQGDQTSRGLYENIGFSRCDWWIFLHDDWHGFNELKEAIEYVIDFKDYNLEGRA